MQVERRTTKQASFSTRWSPPLAPPPPTSFLPVAPPTPTSCPPSTHIPRLLTCSLKAVLRLFDLPAPHGCSWIVFGLFLDFSEAFLRLFSGFSTGRHHPHSTSAVPDSILWKVFFDDLRKLKKNRFPSTLIFSTHINDIYYIILFRHASVSSTYPCPSVCKSVGPLVTLSDFQSLVALSEKWKVKCSFQKCIYL